MQAIPLPCNPFFLIQKSLPYLDGDTVYICMASALIKSVLER